MAIATLIIKPCGLIIKVAIAINFSNQLALELINNPGKRITCSFTRVIPTFKAGYKNWVTQFRFVIPDNRFVFVFDVKRLDNLKSNVRIEKKNSLQMQGVFNFLFLILVEKSQGAKDERP